MEVSKDTFIKKYVEAIRDGNAALFAGAGLSRASGYVDWKNLLRPLAKELKLDIEKEPDLLLVAQYYRNEAGTRWNINQEILNAFNTEVIENKNIEIVCRLPISTYWTTNYDCLIEEGLKKQKRKADVKETSEQLPCFSKDRDAVVYKMHGDAKHPSAAVLTKDDYVLYDKKRPLFRTLLKGDLISKRFLFIGFSFEDPNLDYMLGQVHSLLDENIPNHYCFFKKVQKSDYDMDEAYEYATIKQKLRVKDLARYGIQTVFVNNYAEITQILKDIESAVKKNNVFISGSAYDYGDWEKDKAEELARKLSESLVRNGFKVTSGFGLGIGSSVVNGALNEIYKSEYKKHTDMYLCLRPFPQGIPDETKRKELFTHYRQDMISNTGIAIFLFGNKKDPTDTSKTIDSPGCWEEFTIAKGNKNIIIPIGSTGFMSKKIFDKVISDIDNYKYLEPYRATLETDHNIDTLVNTVLAIVKESVAG